MVLPGQGHAIAVTSTGSSSISWNSLTISVVDATGAPVLIDWTAAGLYGVGADTRSTLSGIDARLSSQPDPYSVSFWDGSWAASTISNPLADPTGTVTGTATTALVGNPSLYSLADINMVGDGFGAIDVAQAIFGGQFTVPVNSTLTVSATYAFSQTLSSNIAYGFASSYLDAGLALYDFNGAPDATGQSPLLASDIRSLSNSITGIGSISIPTTNPPGALSLTWNLSALDAAGVPFVYDFEISTTAKGLVSVPEPVSLILLGSSFFGMAIFRRKLM